VDLSTPGGALGYEDQRGQRTQGFGPLLERGVYRHCGRAGQVEWGDNAALPPRPNFKLAFEIETAGKTAILNHR
jgi:hypothetical protein